MVHDFVRFPELTNSQSRFYYWESPHKQIFDNFFAKVEKVTDGDTIKVSCEFRDFIFPVRLAGIAAPEMNETGGERSRKWLERKLGDSEVLVKIDKKIVWGSLADLLEELKG